MAAREEEPNKLQKRNPEIIEDASFYQDLTYVALMKDIENTAKNKRSVLRIQYDIGYNMKIYLEKKGFKVTNLVWTKYDDYRHKIEW